jgi:hypothetical protein
MTKLTLNLDSLKVESFRTADVQGLRGTVNGAEFLTGPDDCVTISCGDSVHQSCMD